MKKFRYLSKSDKIFYTINATILTLFLIAVLYPVIFVISASLSQGKNVDAGKVILWPVGFTLENYEMVVQMKTIWRGLFNSLYYAGLGTLISIAMTMTAAYALSRDEVPGSRVVMFFYTVTMFFGGGLIPSYLLIRSLGMVNTVWALVIPGAVGAYGIIVARTFIRSSIPKELLEATMMDGGSDIKYYIKVVLPLSKPIIAVNCLNCVVGHWNAYMGPLIYLNDRKKFTLTIYLKEILLTSAMETVEGVSLEELAAMNQRLAAMKYAVMILTMIPVVALYPFIQKHFVKGVMVGSLKG